MRTPSHAGRLLGDLEHRIMRVMWSLNGGTSARDVVDAMREETPIAYTTVVTVMNRLADKKFLRRHANGDCYVYNAVYSSPQKFYSSMAGKMLNRIRQEFGEVAMACFVEEAEKMNRKKLKALLKKLRKK